MSSVNAAVARYNSFTAGVTNKFINVLSFEEFNDRARNVSAKYDVNFDSLIVTLAEHIALGGLSMKRFSDFTIVFKIYNDGEELKEFSPLQILGEFFPDGNVVLSQIAAHIKLHILAVAKAAIENRPEMSAVIIKNVVSALDESFRAKLCNKEMLDDIDVTVKGDNVGVDGY